jgi:hypothetical protein
MRRSRGFDLSSLEPANALVVHKTKPAARPEDVSCCTVCPHVDGQRAVLDSEPGCCHCGIRACHKGLTLRKQSSTLKPRRACHFDERDQPCAATFLGYRPCPNALRQALWLCWDIARPQTKTARSGGGCRVINPPQQFAEDTRNQRPRTRASNLEANACSSAPATISADLSSRCTPSTQ